MQQNLGRKSVLCNFKSLILDQKRLQKTRKSCLLNSRYRILKSLTYPCRLSKLSLKTTPKMQAKEVEVLLQARRTKITFSWIKTRYQINSNLATSILKVKCRITYKLVIMVNIERIHLQLWTSSHHKMIIADQVYHHRTIIKDKQL